MVAGGGNKCVKSLVVIFNLLFCLAGGALLGVSLWLRFDNRIQATFENQLNTNNIPLQVKDYYVAIYILAAIGGLLFVTGFLGCCGAACESTCMLGCFFIIVLVLFLAEVACGIYVLVKKDDLKTIFGEGIRDVLKEKYKPDSKDEETQHFVTSMNKFFEIQQCCGGTGCKDFDSFGVARPAVCQCDKDPERPGCAQKLHDLTKGHWAILGGIAIGILAIELLAMIFSMTLCCALRRDVYYH